MFKKFILRQAQESMFKSSMLILILCLCLTSCSNDDFEYSSPYACRFQFDNKLHQDALMASALTPYSNIFIKISQRKENGITILTLSTSDGKTGEVRLTTDMENSCDYELGANNGIIVGYSTIDNSYVAFDAQCRECYANAGAYTPNRMLTWTSSTTDVKCSHCGRTYDLNLKGINKEGTGKQLWLYHATCTDPYGRLVVTR